MSVKTYQFYCEICNWKRITDGSDIQDLHEYEVSGIPGGIPKLDIITKKVVPTKDKKPLKRFRCPQCGRPVIPRKIPNPQAIVDQRIEEENRSELVAAAEVEQEKNLKEAIQKSEDQAAERRKDVEEKRNTLDGS